jgi:hypothetical protein
VSHQTARRAKILPRTERPLEQSVTVQLLEPLAVLDVGLAAWHLAQMARVDQDDLNARVLQLLGRGNPEHPGRFHRGRLDPAGLQPLGPLVQLATETAKRPHRRFPFRRRVLWHTNKVLDRSDIHAGRMRAAGRIVLDAGEGVFLGFIG